MTTPLFRTPKARTKAASGSALVRTRQWRGSREPPRPIQSGPAAVRIQLTVFVQANF